MSNTTSGNTRHPLFLPIYAKRDAIYALSAITTGGALDKDTNLPNEQRRGLFAQQEGQRVSRDLAAARRWKATVAAQDEAEMRQLLARHKQVSSNTDE